MTEAEPITNPWFQWQQAVLDESFATVRRVSRLPFLWQRAQSVKKGATPSEIVYEEDRLKVLHYPTETKPRYKIPLVFVFALVNRPYILDLKEGRSVVSHFVNAGFDTYLIDWGAPSPADSHLTLDDYINGYMANVVDFVCERTGAPQASLLGYCMGGTMSTMFTALHQEKVRNLMLLAAGIDFAPRDGLINVWADPRYFDVDKFVDAFGNAPAEFLQASFLILKPIQNLIEKPINFLEKMDDDKFLDDFFTMEAWLNDNISVPGEVFRQFVKGLYQQNLLVQNRMPVGKHIVDLRKITCPILNIMARNDDLVPCASSAAFNDLVSSKDRKSIIIPAGHIGLAVGGKAQKESWPEAARWLGERS
jgi:polyhydroxyalkanoate synthase subunit PhaC